MNWTEFFAAQLEREAPISRRALERVSGYKPPATDTTAKLLAAHDESVAKGLAALRKTTDAHLSTPWKLLVGGRMVMEKPRYEMIADTFTHLAHHRGQLTVYLRLNGVPVPSIYGPSADDAKF